MPRETKARPGITSPLHGAARLKTQELGVSGTLLKPAPQGPKLPRLLASLWGGGKVPKGDWPSDDADAKEMICTDAVTPVRSKATLFQRVVVTGASVKGSISPCSLLSVLMSCKAIPDLRQVNCSQTRQHTLGLVGEFQCLPTFVVRIGATNT
ncbi:hypothetical protein BN77_0407 [Rhizobium mesoamericanum STM3625]|uniref:Uncharacterized protein n=1 Tax=Rhizobium mesoamericanum STM3625 TaxID=1211777 RepID=K0PUD6_9HYPH|nr:hypothetical protein BN77_0407 [Rhizobium mesoamericanum STM3625]